MRLQIALAALLLTGAAQAQVSNPSFPSSPVLSGAAAAMQSTDTVPVCQGCSSSTTLKSGTLAQILTFIQSNVALAASSITSGVLAAARGGAGTLTGLVLGNGSSAPTAYAGTGACAASQWMTTLSASGASTCTQPAASDLSNTTTGTAGSAVVLATSPTITTPSIAYEQITNTCNNPATTCTATCTGSKKVTGGGCNFAGSLPASDSFPSSTQVWSCVVAVAPVTSMTAYAVCTGVQ